MQFLCADMVDYCRPGHICKTNIIFQSNFATRYTYHCPLTSQALCYVTNYVLITFHALNQTIRITLCEVT